MRLGLLLPHFGAHADGERIIAGSRRAEVLGFDSVWVRDHLLFEPHGEFESADTAFYDAFTVLAAVGASTSTLTLGTGALIPFRHPLHTAQIAATLTQFTGGRLVLGFGAGNFDHEFDAIGLGGLPRPELVQTNMEILRRIWRGETVDWHDDAFSFSGAAISPAPAGGEIPLWYCGNTPRSARIAAASADGWMPGRISLETLRVRVRTIEENVEAAGRARPSIGLIPSASVASTRERALARINVDGLLRWANNARFWVTPPSGTFSTVEDLRGVLLHGTPDDVVEQLAELRDAGADHVVFDFRLSFIEWEEQLELLGAEVLPKVRDFVTTTD